MQQHCHVWSSLSLCLPKSHPRSKQTNDRPTQLHHSGIHKIGTRYKNVFHLPSAQSKLFQKGVFVQELERTSTFR